MAAAGHYKGEYLYESALAAATIKACYSSLRRATQDTTKVLACPPRDSADHAGEVMGWIVAGRGSAVSPRRSPVSCPEHSADHI